MKNWLKEMSKGMVCNRIWLASCLGFVTMAVGLLTGCPAPTPGTPPAYLLQWGSNGIGDGQFSDLTQPGVFHVTPTGVAVDTSGNIYVTDTGANRIQKFSSTGAFLAKWGNYGTADGQFKYPRGITVDTAGNVYVTDTDNNRIQKFSSAGVFLIKWGSYGTADGQFDQPRGIVVDTAGNVYVVDSNNHRVQKFSGTGVFLGKWGSLGTSTDGQFFHPYDIAVDSAGNVYVTDTDNNRVQKFSGSGVFITKWGSYWNGVGPGDGKFYEPRGITVDSADNVFVSDTDNNRIQKFSSTGVFLVKWGTLGTGNGQFDDPLGIAVDATGNVYVADTGNIRIQKFGKSTSPVKVPVDLGEATLVPDDKKPAPLLPGTIIVNATVNGSPMILNTGTVTFTLTGPLQTYTGHATQTYLNMPVGNYTIGSVIGGPPGTTLFNIMPSPTQTLATGGTITFTLNYKSNPVAAGTVIVNATVDGVTWTGPVSYALTGPQTISGSSVPQTFANVAIGTYALAYTSGGPSGATLLSTTPSASQSLTTGSTITYTLNFRTNKVDTGTVNVNATLDGSPWTGAMNFVVAGPSPISGTSVPLPYSNVPVGNYTLTYTSGGPSNASFVNITPSATQALAAGGATTFTLNFTQVMGWCCKDGSLYQSTQADCARNGGTWYATQAQANEGCRLKK